MLLIYLFLLCVIARSICALRLRRFIAYRLSTVVESLIVITTLRCICIGAILGTCIFNIPASGAPLTTIIV
jgi:hypothetical protein